MASKAYERAFTFLNDMENEELPLPGGSTGRCWRCRKRLSRVKDTEFACEPCFAWMTGESDDDPEAFVKKTNYARPWWAVPAQPT